MLAVTVFETVLDVTVFETVLDVTVFDEVFAGGAHGRSSDVTSVAGLTVASICFCISSLM